MPPSGAPSRKLRSAALDRVAERLFAPVDAAGLAWFRIAFGGVMFYWVATSLVGGYVGLQYVDPVLHFKYDCFAWVPVLPGPGMYLHFLLLGLLSGMMAVGLHYRIAAPLFAVAFTYVFLIDRAQYQNHYYLICLISWLMAVLPAERACSFDALDDSSSNPTVPAWTVWLLRFQIGIPYFFGGIAKIDADWISGQPIRMALSQRTHVPLIGPYLAEDWMVQVFVWGGMLFDLLVVPALLWKPTRMPAFLLAIGFHLTNAILFHIGIFPWFMMLGTAIFFPPDWPRRFVRGRRTQQSTSMPADKWDGLTSRQRRTVMCLTAYMVLQLLVPLRHFLLEGNPHWSERGHYFSWHMMLRGKICGLRVFAADSVTGRSGVVDLRPFLTPQQANRMGRDPEMIRQFARFLARELRSSDGREPEIRVLALVSLNGRKPQPMIDPSVNLAAESASFWSFPHWIVPLREPLRAEPWNVPLLAWEQHVELPEMPGRERIPTPRITGVQP